MDYVKLSEVGNFTVEKVWGYKYKKWDNKNRKMLVSDVYQKDYRRIYELDTDKGKLDVSASQIGSLLESVVKNGKADLNDRSFVVKTNGKTGMDIRYFFNAVIEKDEPKEEPKEDEDFDMSQIPF